MVKNLIFDLGGVILNLDVPKTIVGFSRLSGLSPEKVTELFRHSPGFLAYERGTINDDEFRQFVRDLYKINVSDEDIDKCWNAMLLDLPQRRLHLLANLKKQYRTYLLSNTNTIHLNYLNQHILPAAHNLTSLDDYFHRAYYSHFMGMRKPDAEIFVRVLEDNGLVAAETLFLDDNADNIAGAKAVGLQTAYVNTPDFIIDYFHEHRTT